MRRVIPLITIAALVAPLAAQMPMPKEAPGKPDPARVTAGTFAVDPGHTRVGFSINHFGFNDFFGQFNHVTGNLTLDPAHLSAAHVSIDVGMDGLLTGDPKLNEHLSSPDFFDVAKFASAHFESTSVEAKGDKALIHGNLTMHGVTKPVTLRTKFVGDGINPFTKHENIGFEARTEINRSDWGVAGFIPLVADKVDLVISVAFDKTN